MLILNTQLLPRSIISIHASSPVAFAKHVVINPHNLTISGFFVDYARLAGQHPVLISQDIRQITPKSFVINHEEDITPVEELIRFSKVAELNYELLGKEVRTESKKKVGSVDEYVIQADGMVIYNLHVNKPVWKSLTGGARIINRSQIVEVTDSTIIVKDAVITEKQVAPQAIPAS
ncbi:TPA: hypothetical protein EYO12_03060 [Candidatus Saccharibacteria bacterium]|nr:hypothetical protein [Candidatus Saccharibacteria bacterium]HIO87986.1 hypothetical protein [Candidatus Saccharibacteria bacterium]